MFSLQLDTDYGAREASEHAAEDGDEVGDGTEDDHESQAKGDDLVPVGSKEVA